MSHQPQWHRDKFLKVSRWTGKLTGGFELYRGNHPNFPSLVMILGDHKQQRPYVTTPLLPAETKVQCHWLHVSVGHSDKTLDQRLVCSSRILLSPTWPKSCWLLIFMIMSSPNMRFLRSCDLTSMSGVKRNQPMASQYQGLAESQHKWKLHDLFLKQSLKLREFYWITFFCLF